jgi:hypothetical protein
MFTDQLMKSGPEAESLELCVETLKDLDPSAAQAALVRGGGGQTSMGARVCA